MKFSEFNVAVNTSQIDFIVGYKGLQNFRISPSDLVGTFSSLNYITDSGSGTIDLGTQAFSILGTANEIETSGALQTLTIGFPASGVILPDGSQATTQTIGDNSTKVATTAYVDAAVTAEDLDFSGDTGTGSVDLDSQILNIIGTTNEIETAASGQTLTIGLPDDVSITGELTVLGIGQSSFGGQVTIPLTPVATTDAASKGYVDSQVTAQDLDFTTDSGSGQVDLDSQIFNVLGTANEIETSGSGQTVTIGLPDDVTVTGELTVSGTGQSSFGGQVTIPATPVAGTDAASKDYVDSQVTAQDLDFTGDSGTGEVDLDSQALSITGGAVITTTALNQNLDIVHDNVSRADTTSSSSPAFGGTFTSVDSVSSSSQGHITAINVKTVTLPTPSDATITLDAGTLLNGGGDFTLNQALNETITFNHDSVSRTDTTSTDAPAFGGTFTAVDSVTSSTEGHITAINLKTVTVPTPTYPTVNDNTITISAGSNLNGGGDFTLNQNFDETITVNLDTTITGLTSVTSTTFAGQLDGSISSATTATTQAPNDNSTKVATTAYVDTSAGNYLPLAGGTMSGSIAMGGNNISGGGTATFTTFVGALQGNADTASALAASGNITLTGDTTSTGGPYTYTSGGNVAIATTIADTTVTGKVLTGVNLGTAQVISATDSILDAFGYLQAQITQLPQGLVYQGTWNASTNTPTLASGTGTTGHFYIVSVAGNTNLDGITDWQVGDWAIFVEAGGTDTWQKIDNTSAITGTGATNKLAKWTGPTTLSTGLVEDDGTTVTIGNSGDLDVTGDTDVTGDLAWGASLTDTTNTISITKFVDEADGIPANDNDTSIPTSAAVKDYVDTQIGTVDTLADVLSNGNTTGGTDISVSSGDDITFAANSKTIFNSALQIYNTGTQSVIYANTNNLLIESTTYATVQALSDIYLKPNGGNNGITITGGGAVTLYHNNAQTLATTSGGLQVTGGINTSGNFINVGNGQGNSENYLQLGNSRTGNGYAYIDFVGDTTYTDFGLRIIRGNTGANATSTIEHRGTGNLDIKTTEAANLRLQTASTTALTLDTSQQVQLNSYGSGTFTGTAAYNLQVDSSGNIIETPGSVIDGSGTTNYVSKWQDPNTLTDSVIYDDGTDVGISQTSPNAKLEVYGTANSSPQTANGGILKINSTATNAIVFGTLNSSPFGTYIQSGGSNVYPLLLNPNGGNVGIGTDSPSGKLEVIVANGFSRFWSNNASAYHFVSIGRNASDLELGSAAAANQFFTGTGAGDAVIKAPSSKLHLGHSSGAPAITIDTSNRVGIGTTSPQTYLQIGDYPSNNINQATYPDIPSEHMLHISAPETTNYYGGGISFGENTFTAANIVAIDAGGGGALHLAFGTGNFSGMTEKFRINNDGQIYNSGSAISGNYNTFYGSGALDALTSGQQNTAMGRNAGSDVTTGNYNSFFGLNAGVNVTTGQFNTILGFSAAENFTTASNNTGVGAYALHYATAGQLTAVGYQALFNNTSGTVNVAVGYHAMLDNTTGAGNTAVGYNSLTNNTTGGNNTALGVNSGHATTTGIYNTFLGYDAGFTVNNNENVHIGFYAGRLNTGGENVFIGSQSGGRSGGGNATNCVSVGRASLYHLTTGGNNTAVGHQAGFNVTTGTQNSLFGKGAGDALTTGSYNTMLGRLAGQDTVTGSYNTFVGDLTGYQNTADNNTALGWAAGYAMTSGTRNTALGRSAMENGSGVTGNDNTSVGHNSMNVLTSGANNTAIGAYSGDALTTGSNNVAVGQLSLSGNTTGEHNVAIGRASQQSATGTANVGVGTDTLEVSSGSYNTAVGYRSNITNTTGTRNSTFGAQAGIAISTGNYNTILGFNAGSTQTTASYVTAVGDYAFANNTASNGAALGQGAGQFNTSGDGNTAIGTAALQYNTTGNYNVAVGFGASANGSSYNKTGTVCIGRQAGFANTGDYGVAIGYQAGYNSGSGAYNVSVGFRALHTATSGGYNTAIGSEALLNNATGTNSVAVGFQAGLNSTVGDNVYLGYGAGRGTVGDTGSANVFLGYASGYGINGGVNNTGVGTLALYNLTSGIFNTAVGRNAGQNITTANYNTFLGAYSGDQITTGSRNTLLGYVAGGAITTANDNVVIGSAAGANITTGNDNTIVGKDAGNAITNGQYNSVFGKEAGLRITGGNQNTLSGYLAGQALTTGNYVTAMGAGAGYGYTGTGATFLGFNAGYASSSQSYPTAIGYRALYQNSSGSGLVAMGYHALFGNTTGSENTALGYTALQGNSTGSYNTAVGMYAAYANSTGARNTVVGRAAGFNMTTGAYNTFVGMEAGYSNGGGNYNTCLGYGAGLNSTNSDNTLIGYQSGQALTTGSPNTAVGRWSLYSATTGFANTVMGYDCGASLTSGFQNTAMGQYAMRYATTGGVNVAIGYEAMGKFTATTAGARNVAVGYQAGAWITSGANNVLLGGNAGGSTSPAGQITTASNRVCLGDNNITHLYCATSTITTSDARDKTDVEDLTLGLDFIKELNPKTYRWDKRDWYEDGTPDGSKKAPKIESGLMAQEVLEAEKKFGYATEDNDMLFVDETEDKTKYGMKYERLVPVLINAIKELEKEIVNLKSQINK